jgi:hypothetical protein
LGKTLGRITTEILGSQFRESFSSNEFWDNGEAYIFQKEWLLDLGDSDKDQNDWNRAPAFWFPQEAEQFHTFGLLGLDDETTVYAAVWGTPLSRFAGNLPSVKALWETSVSGPLKRNGWRSYGDKATTPTGQWGLHRAIRLNPREISKAMESDDLRPALTPLEDAIREFSSVCAGIDQIINDLRSKKVPSKNGK